MTSADTLSIIVSPAGDAPATVDVSIAGAASVAIDTAPPVGAERAMGVTSPIVVSFTALGRIEAPLPVSQLGQAAVMELQAALGCLGYPVGAVDGQYGPKLRNAWAEFKTDVFPGNPDLIGPDGVLNLRTRIGALPSIGGVDTSTKQAVLTAIGLECQAQGIGLPAQIAYVRATAQWETAQTFKPVREAFWCDEDWRKANLRYFPYYGRGFVQLTWAANYRAYGDMLGIDLVDRPDAALDGNVALFVLVHGFKAGSFTGRKISDYITAAATDFVGARRCINGTDKNQEIAALARHYLAAG